MSKRYRVLLLFVAVKKIVENIWLYLVKCHTSLTFKVNTFLQHLSKIRMYKNIMYLYNLQFNSFAFLWYHRNFCCKLYTAQCLWDKNFCGTRKKADESNLYLSCSSEIHTATNFESTYVSLFSHTNLVVALICSYKIRVWQSK